MSDRTCLWLLSCIDLDICKNIIHKKIKTKNDFLVDERIWFFMPLCIRHSDSKWFSLGEYFFLGKRTFESRLVNFFCRNLMLMGKFAKVLEILSQINQQAPCFIHYESTTLMKICPQSILEIILNPNFSHLWQKDLWLKLVWSSVYVGNYSIFSLLLSDDAMGNFGTSFNDIKSLCDEQNAEILGLFVCCPKIYNVLMKLKRNFGLQYSLQTTHSVWDTLVKRSSLEILKIFLSIGEVQQVKLSIQPVIQLGSVEILEYFMSTSIVSFSEKFTPSMAFLVAANFGHLDLLKFIHSTFNVREQYFSHALNAASKFGHVAIAEYLLRIGVSPAVQNYSAFRHAASNGNLEIIKLLIPSCRKSVQEYNNLRIPLRNATENGHFDISSYFLRVRQEKSVYCSAYESVCLLFAAQHGHLNVIKMFI